jgi:hypothetical protein
MFVKGGVDRGYRRPYEYFYRFSIECFDFEFVLKKFVYAISRHGGAWSIGIRLRNILIWLCVLSDGLLSLSKGGLALA